MTLGLTCRHRVGLLCCVLVWGLLATHSWAATPAEAEQRGSLIFHFENDILGTDDSDRHYTNGMQLSYQTAENRVWDWLDGWARETLFGSSDVTMRAHWALGQNLYTPEDLSRSDLIADDRPYAGWLHGDLGLVGSRDNTMRVFELSVGMVGPAAQGEEMQKWVHQVIGSADPEGWSNQIGNELAVMLVFEQKWRNVRNLDNLPLLGSLGLEADFSPHGGVALGNVLTYGGLGGTLRLGQGLERDFGPPRIQPSPPGSGYFVPDPHFGWYVFLGVDGRAVLQNIFLDGNTFRDSHRVDKNILVADVLGGFAVSALGVRVGVVYVNRSKEFTLQDQANHFGSITVSFRL
jgi:lipid A 3-O-deacylase